MERGDSISGIQRGGPPLLTYLRAIWIELGKFAPASRDRGGDRNPIETQAP